MDVRRNPTRFASRLLIILLVLGLTGCTTIKGWFAGDPKPGDPAELVGEQQLGGTPVYVLKLTPKEDNAFATAMKIWVSKDWLIRQVEITDVNGAVTTYRIATIKVDQDIPDAKFAYTVPEKAEVIDLR